MKKFILPIIILLIVAFFSPQKINAQIDSECFKEYQKREYKCLQEYNKCIYSCSAENYKSCANNCSVQDKTCSEGASADLTVCKAAIIKDKEDVPSKAELGQDCRKIFDKESYKCLGVSGDCQRKCGEETKRPDGGAYFNSGEVYSKCTKASDCDGKGRACNEQALTNFRACGKSGKQLEAPEAKQEAPVQDKKGLNIFKIFDLFSKAVTNLATKKESTDSLQEEAKPSVEELSANNRLGERQTVQQMGDWIMENDLISDPAWLERIEREKLDLKLYGRTPQMTEETIRQYQEEWNKMFEPSENQTAIPFRARADILKGKAEIKYPGTDEWVSLKQGDVVSQGATLFTGVDTTLVFSVQDKGVFQILPFTEITVSEENIKESSYTEIKLNTGEIEVSIPGGVYTGTLQVTTPSSTTSVRGTHFWVRYDQAKRLAVTGVYKGEVEVTTKDGKTIKVTPDGDELGVLVVTQKLSVVKLALAGVVFIVVVSGIIFIIRKKFVSKGFSKKKR